MVVERLTSQSRSSKSSLKIELKMYKDNKEKYKNVKTYKEGVKGSTQVPSPPRLEICQKIYTTKFLGQKLYTLKVSKLRLFLLKKKQRKCINISYLSSFFSYNLTECVKF